MVLIAVLWAVYVSECFVRWKPGDWVFRRAFRGAATATDRPDVTFLNERFAFVFTSWWPGDIALRCAGDDLNVTAWDARVGALRRETRWLRASASTLFTLLLVVFPLLVVTERLLPWVIWLAAATLVVWGSTLVSFFRTYRRVHGGPLPLELALTNTLSPVSLAVGPTTISIDDLRGAHPVAVAYALCNDDEFLRVARAWHVDSETDRARIEGLAHARGVAARLLAPPVEVEPGASRYCRRCHATYKDGAKCCADCTNVVLTPLKIAARSLELSAPYDPQTTTQAAGPLPGVRDVARERARSGSRRRARHARRNHHRQAS